MLLFYYTKDNYLVGKDERVLVSPYGYNLDAEKFAHFLDAGKRKYKELYS